MFTSSKSGHVLLCCIIAACFLFQFQTARAQIIVAWGGDYVSSAQPLAGKNSYFASPVDADGDAANDDSIGGRRFNLTTPMNPSSGYSGVSGTFYGGMITAHQDDLTSAVFDDADVQNQGPNDELHFHTSHSGHFHDMHMAMLWQQPDFLNGGIPFVFDANSSATLVTGQTSTESMVGAQARLMVRDGAGDFWLSEEFFASPQGNGDSFVWNSFTATSDGSWAAYNPFTQFTGTSDIGSDLRFDQSGTFSDKNFGSVTGVGIYFEQDTFHNNLDVHFESFVVNASNIPEPSSLAMVLAVLLPIGFRRARRR